jgi:hypothetical protein
MAAVTVATAPDTDGYCGYGGRTVDTTVDMAAAVLDKPQRLAILDWLFGDIAQLCAHFVLDRREVGT